MKILSPVAHAALDYITVIFFWVAPSIVALSGTATVICYILGAVHLLLTIFTNFSMGLAKLISFALHGMVELVVAVVLVAVPWLLSDTFNYTDQLFFAIVGVVILLVWLITNYTGQKTVPAH